MDPISVAPTPAPVNAVTPETPSRSPADEAAARPFEQALKQELAKPDSAKPPGDKPEAAQREDAKTEPAAAKPASAEAAKAATVALAEALPEWAAVLENAGLAKAAKPAAATESEVKELIDPAAASPEAPRAEVTALALAVLPTPGPKLATPAAPGAAARGDATDAAIEPEHLIAAAPADVATELRAPRGARKDPAAEEATLRRESAKTDPIPDNRMPAFGIERAAAPESTLATMHATSSVDGLTSGVFAPRWTAAQGPRIDAAAPGQPATARIDTPFGEHGWGDAFQQKIVWLVDRQQQSAELHVNPPHLGPVDVILTFADDGAQIAFSSPHAAVREAIEASLDELRTALNDKGLTMGEALVSADSNEAREQHAEARQASRGSRGSGGAPQATIDVPAPRIVQRGLVDLFA